MEEGRSEKKSLQVPVYLDVRCDLADGSTIKAKVINLGTEGIYIESPDPINVGESLEVEFLLPGTLNSIRLVGEVMWSRSPEENEAQKEDVYVTGIEFRTLEEPYRTLILDYSIRMLDNDDLLRDGGILQVLEALRSLPAADRLKAYHVLIGKGSGPVL